MQEIEWCVKLGYTGARAVVREEGTNEQLSVLRHHGVLNVDIGSGSRLPGKNLAPPLTSCEMLIRVPLYTSVLSL